MKRLLIWLLLILLIFAMQFIGACGGGSTDADSVHPTDLSVDDDDLSDDDDFDDDDFGDDDDDDDDDLVDDDDDDDDDNGNKCAHHEPGSSEYAEVHFLDIPQGLAIYIAINGYDILINGGASDDLNRVASYLLDHGVQHLEELVIASVADEDIGEAEEIISQFGVDLVRKGPALSTSQVYTSLMAAIDQQGATVQVLKAGDTIDNWIGEPERVLSPPDPIPAGFSEKDKSLVIHMNIGNTDILLGDSVGAAAEQWMVQAWDGELCAEILAIGDHGSGAGTTDEWLAQVRAKEAMIVAAFRNPELNPDAQTVQRIEQAGANIWLSKDEGNMNVISTGFDYEIVCGV